MNSNFKKGDKVVLNCNNLYKSHIERINLRTEEGTPYDSTGAECNMDEELERCLLESKNKYFIVARVSDFGSIRLEHTDRNYAYNPVFFKLYVNYNNSILKYL